MAEVICEGRSTREINSAIKSLLARGENQVLIKRPGARHNLGVGILRPGELVFDGSVGYYCAGMGDGPRIEIKGSAGWGLAESMLSGTVVLHGSAGNGAGAAIRGGTIVIHGSAAARAGVSMKGGLILIGGDCGYMAGFMGQKGTLIVCGDTGEGFADSMYETVCFVGGNIAELGNDAVIEEPTAEDCGFIHSVLSRYLPDRPVPVFKKVVSGRKLWNFSKTEWSTWREAL